MVGIRFKVVWGCPLPPCSCSSSCINSTQNENPSNASNATMNICLRPRRSYTLQQCIFGQPLRSFSSSRANSRFPSPSGHKWSHPPSSITIADDEVASLASKPLHSLSLADLVKYTLPRSVCRACTNLLGMAGPLSVPTRCSPPRTSLSPSYLSASHIAFSRYEICHL